MISTRGLEVSSLNGLPIRFNRTVPVRARCFWVPLFAENVTTKAASGPPCLPKMCTCKISKRASRVPLGKRALGNCWAKGPAVVGIRGTLGNGALWASRVLGGWANGAFGVYSAAIPNGKPFRVDVISIETRFWAFQVSSKHDPCTGSYSHP